MSREQFTAAQLADFKAVQRLAYDATAAVEAQLYVGITEKEAAAMLEDWLRERGVRRFFHYGFAWFGDRTRFRNFEKPSGNALKQLLSPKMAHFGKQFLPTDRRLEKETRSSSTSARSWGGRPPTWATHAPCPATRPRSSTPPGWRWSLTVG